MAKMCVARSTSVAVSGWLRNARDIDPAIAADLDRMHARRLPAHRVHAGRVDFDVLAIAEQTAEKSLRHGTAANVARTDKENVFHNYGTRRRRRAPR